MESVGRPPESAARSTDAGPLVELGRVVKRHGVRGEVRMLPYNPASTIAAELSSVFLSGEDGSYEKCRVTSTRRHKQFVLLRLEGVTTVDQAEAVVGRTIAIAHEQLPPTGPREAYHVDLLGCVVRTDTGQDLGTVHEMIVTGSNDVCVVRGRGREYLVPLVEDVIVRLDTAAGEIIIHPLPGLLEP